MSSGRRTIRATRQAPLVLAFFAGHSLAADIPQLDCVVEPHMVIDLSTQIDGIVDTMRVERGDFVEADQILVTLDSGVEQA